jgi:hypothetical protein
MSAPPDPEKQNHRSSYLLPAISSPPLVIQCEGDGQYQVGWHDEADGPFPSRNFVEAVATRCGNDSELSRFWLTSSTSPSGCARLTRHASKACDGSANCLGLGRDASYEAARRGDIPTIRIGKLLRVPKLAFHRMLEAAGAIEKDRAG